MSRPLNISSAHFFCSWVTPGEQSRETAVPVQHLKRQEQARASVCFHYSMNHSHPHPCHKPHQASKGTEFLRDVLTSSSSQPRERYRRSILPLHPQLGGRAPLSTKTTAVPSRTPLGAT